MRNLSKEFQIIATLNSKTNWMTANNLAKELGFSIRYIKYAISDLNNCYDNLISSSNRGYKIDKSHASKLLAEVEQSVIPQSYEERKRYIINHLLLKQEKLSISSLSESLCISPITLQNELSKIRHFLSDFKLNLRTKNDIVIITGTSRDKRSVIISLLNDELQKSFLSLQWVQKVFTMVDLQKIKNIVIDSLDKYEYFLDDYALLNYVLHLALTIELRSNESYSEIKKELKTTPLRKLGSPHVVKIINELYARLKEIYETNYDLEDIYEASILMMTRAISKQIKEKRFDEFEAIFSKDVQKLMHEIVISVKDTYGIDLSSDNFKIRFSFHLKNLMVRIEHDIDITNLQFSNIKNNYPLIYAVSVHISDIINSSLDTSLSEDEIAYIALHIGVLIEESKAAYNKIKCVLVCPDYHDIAKNLLKKLSTVFSESIQFVNVVLSFNNDLDFNNIDLILSTVPVNPRIGIQYQEINPFLTESDIKQIFNKIEDIKMNKIKTKFKQKILYFFHEELLFTDTNFENSSEAIEFMCGTMLEKKLVDEDYKSEIYKHEKLSASSYGNVAIPHPLNNRAQTSVIATAISPQPLTWGINEVNLVFMLSLKEEDKELFADIFDFIVKIIKDDIIFKRILEVKNFDEFINILVSAY